MASKSSSSTSSSSSSTSRKASAAVVASESVDGKTSKENGESHLFGRMSKKLAQLTKLSRSNSAAAAAAAASMSEAEHQRNVQHIAELERRLEELESDRDRLSADRQQSDADQRIKIQELVHGLGALQTDLDRNRAEHGRLVDRLRDEHRRAMGDATAQWQELEAKYRLQIDTLNAECAQAVSELARLRQQPSSSLSMSMSSPTDVVAKDSDVTDDPDEHKISRLMEADDSQEYSRLKELAESLQGQLDDANDSLVTLAITLAEVREEHEYCQQSLRDAQQEVQQLTTGSSQLTATQNEQKVRIAELEAEKTKAEELVRELSHGLDTLKRKTEILEGRVRQAQTERRQLEASRTEEHESLQKNLADTMETLRSVEDKYEFLRKCNAEREQQLLEDYEWKLREIERGCKNQTEKLKEAQHKLLEEHDKMALERTSEATEKIVLTEAELRQLRGFSNELQKGMKVASAQVDQMRLLELRLRGELRDTKAQLQESRDAITRMQAELTEAVAAGERRLRAKELTFKYTHDERIKELAAEYNERLKEESIQLKNDLLAQYTQQKIQDLQELSLQKDEEMADVIRNYEQRFQSLTNEVSRLTTKLEDTEKQLTDEIHLIKMAANAKSAELQRQLEAKESDYQRRGGESRAKEQQLEDLQMQLSAHRATLDLVRIEAEKIKDDEIEQLKKDHERQLERVTREWEERLREALDEQIEVHKAQIQLARVELQKTMELATQKQKSQHECIDELKQALNDRDEAIKRLTDEVQRLQVGLSKMSTELDFHGHEILRVRQEASRQLRVASADSSSPTSSSSSPTADDANKDRRAEDKVAIRQLREALMDKDRLVKKLQEEKRTLQSELSQRVDHYRQLSTSQPVVGAADIESMSVPKLRTRRIIKDSSKRLSAPILSSPLLEEFYANEATDGSRKKHNLLSNKHKSQKRK